MRPNHRDDAVSLRYTSADVDEPVLTIVEAVARAKGLDPSALAPLNHAVDVDALGTLFAAVGGLGNREAAGVEPAGTLVSFSYEDCEVTVEEGRVRVVPAG